MGKTTDAGHERQRLARDLADWKTATFWPPERADRWHRRARRLARACGLPVSTVISDLERDAEAILNETED